MLQWVDDHRCFLDGVSFELRDWGEGFTTDDPASLFIEKPRFMLERYVALLQGPKRLYRMELPQPRWEQLQDGQRFEAVIQGGEKVLELK